MAKTTYKIGDKVRILDADKIGAGFDLETGKEYPIGDVDEDGDIYVIDGADYPLIIADNELQYIEKVEESDAKMTQFKVGDKVKFVNGPENYYTIGNAYEVLAAEENSYRITDNDGQRHNWTTVAHDCFELISQKPTKKQRLTTLEQKVEAMQAEIDALKATQKPPVTVIADAIKRYQERTPNEQRKAIIDEAKAFVEELSDIIKGAHKRDTKFGRLNDIGYTYVLKSEFHVNNEKRVVTVLMKGANSDSGKVYAKAIAKCAPDDVFNADIGKAIALGRALGLVVSKFEKAIQPSKVVVGMNVKNTGSAGGTYSITYVEGKELFIRENDGSGPYFEDKYAVIIDDTEAQY